MPSSFLLETMHSVDSPDLERAPPQILDELRKSGVGDWGSDRHDDQRTSARLLPRTNRPPGPALRSCDY